MSFNQTKINYVTGLNVLALLGSAILVLMAFCMQIFYGELPCALCNLQRLAFLLFGSGLLTVILYPDKYKNGYLVSGLSAVVGALIAITQVFIHILPGASSVGSAVFGLHMYAWTFLLYNAAVIYLLIIQFMHHQRAGSTNVLTSGINGFSGQPVLIKVVISFYILISVTASLSAFAENGFQPFLEGGQQHYWLMEVIKHPGITIIKDMLMQK